MIYGAKVGKFTTAEDCNSAARASNDAGNESGAFAFICEYSVVSADPCFALGRYASGKNDD